MRVDLFADPACPWCWRAYQWLDRVAGARALALGVRPFSLLLRDGIEHLPAPIAQARAATHRAVRVMAAIDEAEARRAFYAAFTRPLHEAIDAGRPPEPAVAAALARAGVAAPAAAAAADDASLDAGIEKSMAAATEATGNRTAEQKIPVLLVDGRPWPAPLVTTVPDTEAAIELWDSLAALAARPDVAGVVWARRP